MIISIKKSTIVIGLFVLFLIPVHVFSQPTYADVAISHTSCAAPCNSGVENASYASDNNLDTYALVKNNLAVGNTVEIVVGFSNPGAPGSMIVIPIKKSTSLLDAGLLSLIVVEVLDASDNIIVQKSGLSALDIGVLSTADETSTIALFAPPTGSFVVSKVRLKLAAQLNVQTSVFVGDAFYVEPSGSGCGIRYATTHDDGGSGICLGCSVNYPERATDAILTNYTEINVVVGLGATRYLEMGWGSAGSTGDFVGVIMGTGSGLLNISLLSNVNITLYNGTTAGQSVSASSLLSASILSGGSQYSLVGFNATAPFTSVRVTMNSGIGLLNSMRIYGAITYDPTPPVVTLSVTPGTNICEGTASQISATAGFAGYAWSSGQATQNISVDAAGSYAVVCTNSEGCPFFSPPVRIGVMAKPQVPSVSAEPLSCLGGNVRFSLGGSSAAYKYQIYKLGDAVEGETKAGTGTAMSLYSVPVFLSAAYRIQVTDTLTGCKALSGADIHINAPSAPSQLSAQLDYAKCWVKPGNRYVHFIQPGTERIIASINPKTNDLGEVEVYSYVNEAPADLQACGTYQSWFVTSVLNRSWMIEPSSQPATSVDVRMYFDHADFNALSTQANLNANPNDDLYTVSEMVLSKYDGLYEDGDFYNNCGNGNTVMLTSTGNGVISANFASFYAGGRYIDYTVSGFSEFWLHGNSNGNVSPLPIVLTGFGAECANGQVDITWTTATEINNAFFIVSKSADAITWETVEVIAGAGNSNHERNYATADMRASVGTSYYRLHQVDLDGTVGYFELVSVSCGGDIPSSIFPNPAEEQFTLSISHTKNDDVLEIGLYDISGKKVMSKSVNISNGNNEIRIDRNGLYAGTYFVHMKSVDKNLIEKIIFR